MSVSRVLHRSCLGGHHAAASQRGSSREENQDVAWASSDQVIVADGVGATALGGLAAHESVARLAQFWPRPDRSDNEAALHEALLLADAAIRARTAAEGRHGSAVFAAAWRVGHTLLVANCGDVEIVIWRRSLPERIEHCSADHSFRALGIAVKSDYDDTAPARQIGNGPRWLGDEAAELRSYSIADGDVVLAMSDGVHRFVAESALLPILMAVSQGRVSATEGCLYLNEAALAAGSEDDRSCAMLIVRSSCGAWLHRARNAVGRLIG